MSLQGMQKKIAENKLFPTSLQYIRRKNVEKINVENWGIGTVPGSKPLPYIFILHMYAILNLTPEHRN